MARLAPRALPPASRIRPPGGARARARARWPPRVEGSRAVCRGRPKTAWIDSTLKPTERATEPRPERNGPERARLCRSRRSFVGRSGGALSKSTLLHAQRTGAPTPTSSRRRNHCHGATGAACITAQCVALDESERLPSIRGRPLLRRLRYRWTCRWRECASVI